MKITRKQLRQMIQEQMEMMGPRVEQPNPYVIMNVEKDPDGTLQVTYIDKEWDPEVPDLKLKEKFNATVVYGGYWFDDYGDIIDDDRLEDLEAALEVYRAANPSPTDLGIDVIRDVE